MNENKWKWIAHQFQHEPGTKMAKAVYLHTNLIVFDLSEGVRPHVMVASELKGSFLNEKQEPLPWGWSLTCNQQRFLFVQLLGQKIIKVIYLYIKDFENLQKSAAISNNFGYDFVLFVHFLGHPVSYR